MTMTPSALKKAMYCLMLGGLLVAAACNGGGGVQTYRPTSYPVYGQPYYPDLSIQEDDPQFWQMLMNSQGGG